MQIGILESNNFSLKALDILEEFGSISFLEKNDLLSFISDKDILFTRLSIFVGKQFLHGAKKLKFLCSPTTGLNHIDVDECQNRKIEIISLRGETEFLSGIRATPEHTFGLVLSLLRNYKFAFLSEQNSLWNREIHKGFELNENKVGFVGMGRIGKILAHYFRNFGANIYYYDIDSNIVDKNANKCSTLEEVLVRSNIIILSASYTESNYQFFNKKYIDLLEDKYFVNTSRGELVDEVYLIEKIKQNFFRGIAIDTIQNEQAGNNLSNLLKCADKKNVIITPHIAGATYNSMSNSEEFIVKKLKKCLNESNV